MSIISDLEINGYKDNQLPDRLINSSDCNSLAAEFIVSRTPDGAPVSRIKDDVWNVRMYDPQNRCVYDFLPGAQHQTTNWQYKSNKN